uniref:tRNA threonylcarbamoyladenosine biosynthesis protein TsaE n=1 Tax=uncultured bacterium contig00060 TaxID=1181543 RepID=A0A806KER8_9BACT|nr:ATPase YjeE [uncultured bacterium contig00060]
MKWKPREGFLIKLVSASPQETFNIGQRIAALLSQGSVIALKGVLGSGKTHLTKGIASGLGINENITSPTYTIISEYQIDDLKLYHIDAYRLNNDKDFEDIGGPEIINSNGISVIEWSDRITKSIPKTSITISLEITGNSSRLITLNGIEKL